MIIIAGYEIVDEADRDAYVAAFRDLVNRARAADGCVDVAISADSLDLRRINTIEIWRDRDALNAWRRRADAPNPGIKVRGIAMKLYNATDGGSLF
jgi:quinol monooxygenase YgiN